MAHPYTVVWSGVDRRAYFHAEHHPAVEPIAKGRGADLTPRRRVTDSGPQRRLYDTLMKFEYAFTVKDLAQAAQVSNTLARRYLEVGLKTKRVQRAGFRRSHRTRVQIFRLTVSSPLEISPPSTETAHQPSRR